MHEDHNAFMQFLEWIVGLIALLFAGTWGYILKWRNELVNFKMHVAESHMTKTEIRDEIKSCTESLRRDVGAVDAKVGDMKTSLEKLVDHLLHENGRNGR